MDRREFIKGAGAGTALATAAVVPGAALAAGARLPGAHGASDAAAWAASVFIVYQEEWPQAGALARALAQTLAREGTPHVVRALPARALGDAPRVAALLDDVAGARVIGVMDDASAVIVQAMAGSRGAGFMADRRHHFPDVRLVSFVMTV